MDILNTREDNTKLTTFRETVRLVIYALIKGHLSREEYKALPRRIESLGTATREAYTNFSLFSGDPPISAGETNLDMISCLLRSFPNGMRSFGALQPSSEGVEDRHEIRHEIRGNGAIQQLLDARFVSTAGNADYAELEVTRVENMFTSAGKLCSTDRLFL